jgi:hypothetical protein
MAIEIKDKNTYDLACELLQQFLLQQPPNWETYKQISNRCDHI